MSRMHEPCISTSPRTLLAHMNADPVNGFEICIIIRIGYAVAHDTAAIILRAI